MTRRVPGAADISSARRDLNDAVRLFEEGRTDEAEAVSREILKRQPHAVEALNILGVISWRKGLRPAGEALIREALTLRPHYADAHNNVGVMQKQRGDLVSAISSFRRAISFRGDYADAHRNLGMALRSVGKLGESESHLRIARTHAPTSWQVACDLAQTLMSQGKLVEAASVLHQQVATKPDLPQAHYDLGLVLLKQANGEAARRSFMKVVALQPDNAQAHCRLGDALQMLERFEDAVTAYERALSLKGIFGDALNNLGNSLTALGRMGEAIDFYKRALEGNPNFAAAHNNLGLAFQSENKMDLAARHFTKAIAIRPDHAEAHSNLGNVLAKEDNFNDAEKYLRRAISLRPNFPEAHNNLGIVLRMAGRLDGARAEFEAALGLKPSYADAICNLGNVFKDRGDLREAIACYRRAAELKPGFANANWNEAIALLLGGNFQEGWEKYEWRWKREETPPFEGKAHWDGRSLAGETVLLRAEQGLGDAIQFCRYAKLVKQRGARVVLECREPLASLMAGLGGVDQVVVKGEELPNHDYQIPLLSLPRIFETNASNIPSRVPYLWASDDKVGKWRKRLGGSGFKVGLVWFGSAQHKNDRNRAISAELLAPLLSVDGVRFFGLNKEQRVSDTEVFRSVAYDFEELGASFVDFSDTAAAVSLLDLVITVDTSVAHLAGALGRPVWTLLPFAPDWRWLLQREDTPWYPTMRLIRQERLGEWAEVAGRAKRELQQLVDSPLAPKDPLKQIAEAKKAMEGGRFAEAEARCRVVLSEQVDLPEAHYLLGLVARKRSSLIEAESHLREAVNLRPDDAVMRTALAVVLRDQRKLDEALASHQRAIALDRDDVVLRHEFAETLRQCGELEDALKAFDEAIALDSGLIDAHKGRSRTLSELGRLEEAALGCSRLTALAPRDADAHTLLGNILMDAGNVSEAISAFERAAHVGVDSAEAHINLGTAQIAARQFKSAAANFGIALEVDPKSVAALVNLAVAEMEGEDLDSAAQNARRAIEIDPCDIRGHSVLGLILKKEGKLEESERSLRRVVILAPEDANAHNNLGGTLRELGRPYEAIENFRRAVKLDAKLAGALSNLGNALRTVGELTEARSHCERALSADPNFAGAHNNLGAVLSEAGDHRAAISSFRRAISLRPDDAAFHNNLGNELKDGGRVEEAIVSYEHAISLEPDFAAAHTNLGTAFQTIGKLKSATASHRHAISLDAGSAIAHNNLGSALKAAGRFDDALSEYRQAILIEPNYAKAHWNEGLILLLKGDLAAGSAKYAWRRLVKGFKVPRRGDPRQHWNGETLGGKTILLYGEQGIGDTIQFCRYVPLIKKKAARVILECPPGLKRLLTGLEGADQVIAAGEVLPEHDYHASLMDLPRVLETTVSTIPAAVPYISPPTKWFPGAENKNNDIRPTVGIVWFGRANHSEDQKRSIPAQLFSKLLKVEGIQFVGLNKEQRNEDVALLRAVQSTFSNIGSRFQDFADTAAALANVDLVISVDTAVAHLAGAQGVPVWTLLPFVPDWRWFLDREDTPWYPTMRLFRCTRSGDWDEVLERVSRELKLWLTSRNQQGRQRARVNVRDELSEAIAVKNNRGHSNQTVFFSQHGQDRYLEENYFKGKTNGSFVDIGAHDGESGSNTLFFERFHGWTGICIEPARSQYETLVKSRTAECLNVALSDFEGEAEFLEVTKGLHQMGGLTNDLRPHVRQLIRDRKGSESQVVSVPVTTFGKLAAERDLRSVDYCSIDVEGAEIKVLGGIDFAFTNISVVSIENPPNLVENFHRIRRFLEDRGFQLVTTIGSDDIFVRR